MALGRPLQVSLVGGSLASLAFRSGGAARTWAGAQLWGIVPSVPFGARAPRAKLPLGASPTAKCGSLNRGIVFDTSTWGIKNMEGVTFQR